MERPFRLPTRPANYATEPRKWREAKRRPITGNSPNDRMLRGPDCNRPKRVCADFFPATPLLPLPGLSKTPGMRFLRHAESIGPMRFSTPEKTGAGVPPPVGRPRAQLKGRDGRSAPRSSSAMSSDRLFLERVARQQSPSLLHRQPEHNTHPWDGLGKGDISTLLGRVTFLLCVDTHAHCYCNSSSRAL